MANADRYFEDVPVGDTWTGEPILITEADIVGFASLYDPQPMHTDPAAAAAGPFGTLIASGWHLLALIMRPFAEARPFGATPILGMGVDELRWHQPVRPGDRLTVRREVISAKQSSSKPDRGVLKTLVEVTNQAGIKVMSFYTISQMPTRQTRLSR
jgi:acyl dehydratase